MVGDPGAARGEPGAEASSGSHSRSVGDPGAAKGDPGAAKASLVLCSNCGAEAKRFKTESVWEWDDQEAEEGHWLHTCAQCIMTREGLPTIQAAKAWIMDNSQAAASVLLALTPCFTRVLSAHPHAS